MMLNKNKDDSYCNMFQNCTSIKEIPAVPRPTYEELENRIEDLKEKLETSMSRADKLEDQLRESKTLCVVLKYSILKMMELEDCE